MSFRGSSDHPSIFPTAVLVFLAVQLFAEDAYTGHNTNALRAAVFYKFLQLFKSIIVCSHSSPDHYTVEIFV